MPGTQREFILGAQREREREFVPGAQRKNSFRMENKLCLFERNVSSAYTSAETRNRRFMLYEEESSEEAYEDGSRNERGLVEDHMSLII